MRELSWQAKTYVLSTILVGSLLLAWNLLQINELDLWLLLALGGFGALALSLKKYGSGISAKYTTNSLFVVFTWLLFGVPAGALVAALSHLLEWLWAKNPWYKQAFNLAALLAGLQISGAVYIRLNPAETLNTRPGVLAVLAALAVYTLANHFLVGAVVWLVNGENFARSGAMDLSMLLLDFTSLSMSAVAALVWRYNPLAVFLCVLALYPVFATLRIPALERQSETDPKTGLFNARYFERALHAELNRANRSDRPLTVVMADLDLLRNINNTYGHLAGDEVLLGVADILKNSLREYDLVARFGGEEFAIMIPEAEPEQVIARIESIRACIAAAEFTVPMQDKPIRATMSFGVAGRGPSSQSPRELLNNSDIALYQAKTQGRNRTWVYQVNGANSR